MTELNAIAPIKIKVIGPYTFSIGDTSKYGEYVRGGIATQVKIPQTIRFGSLAEQQKQPDFDLVDFAKFERPQQLHIAYDVLHEFIRLNGRTPRPWNEDDAKAFINLANERKPDDVELNEQLLTTFAKVHTHTRKLYFHLLLRY